MHPSTTSPRRLGAPALCFAIAATCFSACGTPRSKDHTTQAGDALTGAVDESTFQSLHQLTDRKVPTLLGTSIDVAGASAYLSLPEGIDAPMPGIVVIHEWWGLNDHIRHWTDRLAAAGFAAIAIDLYGGQVATKPDQAMKLMRAVDANAARNLLVEAHDLLRRDPRIRAPKTGSIGWCFGGGKSLDLAITEPELDACVLYYGHPETDPATLRTIRAPVLGIFGTQDQSIPPSKVAEFNDALEQASIRHRIASFPAEHAFANPSSAKYAQTEASAAWQLVREFFDAELR